MFKRVVVVLAAILFVSHSAYAESKQLTHIAKSTTPVKVYIAEVKNSDPDEQKIPLLSYSGRSLRRHLKIAKALILLS